MDFLGLHSAAVQAPLKCTSGGMLPAQSRYSRRNGAGAHFCGQANCQAPSPPAHPNRAMTSPVYTFIMLEPLTT